MEIIARPCSSANSRSSLAALHGAVVVDDLDEHAGRGEPGEPGQVDGGLGVAAPDEHAALAVAQREDVAGPGDLPRLGRGVGQRPGRCGPGRRPRCRW